MQFKIPIVSNSCTSVSLALRWRWYYGNVHVPCPLLISGWFTMARVGTHQEKRKNPYKPRGHAQYWISKLYFVSHIIEEIHSFPSTVTKKKLVWTIAQTDQHDLDWSFSITALDSHSICPLCSHHTFWSLKLSPSSFMVKHCGLS